MSQTPEGKDKVVSDYRSYPGLTVLVSIGKWCGFMPAIGKAGIRIALGWLAISIYFFEFESFTTDAVSALRKLNNPDDPQARMMQELARKNAMNQLKGRKHTRYRHR